MWTPDNFVESALVLIRKMGANRFLRSEGAEYDA
jgi:hypothetical protein